MKTLATELDEVVLLAPDVFADGRGYLVEQYAAEPCGAAGLVALGPQGERIAVIDRSHSVAGTVRGMHFQEPDGQGKLVWAARGRAWNVALDVRRGSPSFGRWTARWLSGDDHLAMWIPSGFAHGYATTDVEVDLYYACTAPFRPAARHAVRWNDPGPGIEWPLDAPLLSERDANAPLLEDARVLPSYRPRAS